MIMNLCPKLYTQFSKTYGFKIKHFADKNLESFVLIGLVAFLMWFKLSFEFLMSGNKFKTSSFKFQGHLTNHQEEDKFAKIKYKVYFNVG